jgi:hypothetical protein
VGRGTDVDGRYPKALMLVGSYCSDPARETEFNRWYNHVHVPDWTASGMFEHGARFANTDPQPPDIRFLAIYESNADQPGRAFEDNRAFVRARGPDRGFPGFTVSVVDVFRRLGGEFRAAVRPVKGIMAVTLDCPDPSREVAFNRWYEDVHIADILESGLFHTAYRYESLAPPGSRPKGRYLSIYETELDPRDAGDGLKRLRPVWMKEDRLFEGVEVILRITARRLWPAV